MLSLNVGRYTKALRNHDRNLFAEMMPTGIVHVYRKHPMNLSPAQFVFAITDNWTANGRPVEWGVEPLMAKLKAIDLMNNPDLFDDLCKSYERAEMSKERARKNSFEAMAYDMHSSFKKTFFNTNTTGLSKETRRKQMGY